MAIERKQPDATPAHEAEVSAQAAIAEQIDESPAAPKVETVQEPAPAAAEEVEVPTITLTPVGDEIVYPLTLSLAGQEDIVFEGPQDTAEVPANLLEDVKPVVAVEVVE